MTTPSGGTPTSLPTTSTITSSAAGTPSAPGTGGLKSQTSATSVTSGGPVDREQIYQWILELASPDTRETALLELSKKREVVPDLAPMLWHSFGTIAALLQVCIQINRSIMQKL